MTPRKITHMTFQNTQKSKLEKPLKWQERKNIADTYILQMKLLKI